MATILAYDGGTTATRAALYDDKRDLRAEAAGGPCNPIEVGIAQCAATLVSLARELTREPAGVVVGGISGAGQPDVREALARRLGDQLGARRIVIANDLVPVLFANAGTRAAVLVIAGTGSSVLAQSGDGRSVIVGGRGAVFGDEGSAYQIGVCGLRAAAYAVDGMGPETALTGALAEAAGVAAFNDLVAWSAQAAKHHVAALARTVDAVAATGDAVALECITAQATRLAGQTVAAVERFPLSSTAPVYMHGAVFERSALFRRAYEASLAERMPGVKPTFPRLRGHRAVLELALQSELPMDRISECLADD